MKNIKKFERLRVQTSVLTKVKGGGKAKMADKAMNAITQYISS
jgi:hypothetical protein